RRAARRARRPSDPAAAFTPGPSPCPKPATPSSGACPLEAALRMKLLYQFSAGDSFLHRLDPRTKLVFVVCFLISTFLLPHPWVMPLVIIAIIWILGRVSPLEYLA